MHGIRVGGHGLRALAGVVDGVAMGTGLTVHGGSFALLGVFVAVEWI